jgi:hypothetical protein
MRNYAWMTVCGMAMSGGLAMAQQPMPFGNPGGYGYPGYPVPAYGPPPNMQPMPYGPMPMMPGGMLYRQPMPNMPYGNEMPVQAPPDPRLPVGQAPASRSTYSSGGPQQDATEPYFVLPDSVPATRATQTPPEPTRGNIVTEPLNRFVQFVAPSLTSEPYTTYEGPRYPAEVRLDNTRVWAQANFIHWWVRRDSTPPLATTGSAATPNPGALGNTDTSVLIGDGSIGPKEFSGIQTTLGIWLDPERLQSLEVGGFWLGKNSRQYSATSDAVGNPVIVQPVLIPTEANLAVAFPGTLAGKIAVNSVMDFSSLELNFVQNAIRVNGWSIDSLVGIRYLYLNDTLNINQNVTVLPGGAGMVPFNNVGQPAGANFLFNDSFNITNRFYGAQLGARVNWTCKGFDVGATLKVGLGATSHVAIIDGFTTLNVAGATTSAPGSSLAQASNIGRITSTDFSVVPELTLTVGYQLTPHLRVLLGYTAFDWNRIQRAGTQIDRRIDQTQSPTSPTFVPGTIGTNPIFPGNRTDFWAQGVNVGMELKF